jgi:3-deoxy-manno-octulosonate cytidylyltransferase (CMP-KDO synthetase)
MIRRVCEQAWKAKLDDVVVATDDVRIADEVMSFGGKYVLTDPNHRSGTDRCCEAMDLLAAPCDAVVNIQGDEPFINPRQIDQIADLICNEGAQLASLAKRIEDEEELFSPNTVKVVMDGNGHALYFSRNPIPYMRNVEKKDWLKQGLFYKHIGIYAYRAETLRKVALLEPSPLELAESLEQLRWLENGMAIRMGITTSENVSIDLPSDLKKAELFADNNTK